MSMCVGGTSGKEKNKACKLAGFTFLPDTYEGSLCLHPSQCLLFGFFFLVIIIASGERWTLNVVLICIFPMASEGISSFENCLCVSLAHLLTRLLYFLVFSFWVL